MKVCKGHPRIRGYTPEDNKERYKLHQMLKKMDISYNPYIRTIYNAENDTAPVTTLILKFGYIIENNLKL